MVMPALSSDAIVQSTLVVLGVFSIATWTVVLVKAYQHTRAGFSSRGYMRKFWAAPTLAAATGVTQPFGPAARIALAGFEVLREQPQARDLAHSGDRRDLLERCLRQQLQKERHALENGLALLASIGSNHVERGRTRRSDLLQRVHDAPHGAEQTDERSGAADTREQR